MSKSKGNSFMLRFVDSSMTKLGKVSVNINNGVPMDLVGTRSKDGDTWTLNGHAVTEERAIQLIEERFL